MMRKLGIPGKKLEVMYQQYKRCHEGNRSCLKYGNGCKCNRPLKKFLTKNMRTTKTPIRFQKIGFIDKIQQPIFQPMNNFECGTLADTNNIVPRVSNGKSARFGEI